MELARFILEKHTLSLFLALQDALVLPTTSLSGRSGKVQRMTVASPEQTFVERIQDCIIREQYLGVS